MFNSEPFESIVAAFSGFCINVVNLVVVHFDEVGARKAYKFDVYMLIACVALNIRFIL